jgi:hypothetical protein
MAYFYSLRGWLELEAEQFEQAIALVKSLQMSYEKDPKPGLYLQGWCWGESPVNWTRYLFYGADVTAEGLEWFQDTLIKLLALNLNLSGYFHAQGEDGEKTMIYRVIENQIYQEKSRILMV